MGFLITLILLIVIGIAIAIILDKYFYMWNYTGWHVTAIMLIVVPIIILFACGVQALTVDSERIEKTQEYEELLVYTEFVENHADDPGVHLIHEAKIAKWNRQYENYEAKRNHPYWGLLFFPNIYRDCSTIEFDSMIDNQYRFD